MDKEATVGSRETGSDTEPPVMAFEFACPRPPGNDPRTIDRAREAAERLFPAQPGGAPAWYLERKASEIADLTEICRGQFEMTGRWFYAAPHTHFFLRIWPEVDTAFTWVRLLGLCGGALTRSPG